MDRVWFHPSELGASITALRERGGPRAWVAALTALAVGIVGTVAVLSLTGELDDAPTTTSTPFGFAVSQSGDSQSLVGLPASVGRNLLRIAVQSPTGEVGHLGSGFAVAEGRVVTAAHLLDGLASGSTISVVTSANRTVPATLAGVDLESDLAVFKVAGEAVPIPHPGSGDGLQVGQPVVAMALDDRGSAVMSLGIVAATRRIERGPSGVLISGLVETDTRSRGTDAGGALLDVQGNVVAILTGYRNLAVPIEAVRDVAAQLASRGTVAHGYLGIAGVSALEGGVRVQSVAPGSPAEAAGILVGDVVTEVSGVDIGGMADLVSLLRRHKPADAVDVDVMRGPSRKNLRAELTTSTPTADPGPFYG
jgi:putative serine protease PepD